MVTQSTQSVRDGPERIPVLLLKTKNTPEDNYQLHFQSTNRTLSYDPIFMPVLSHKFSEDAAGRFQELVTKSKFLEAGIEGIDCESIYGGLIFTSQRAIEAFVNAVSTIEGWRTTGFNDPGIPFFVVGPATAQALRELNITGPNIVGESSGRGETLAYFIKSHYSQRCWRKGWLRKPPLLFLVGEQRRDAIPKILNNPELPEHSRIRVDELVMYETTQRKGFQEEFSSVMKEMLQQSKVQWVVVFSPQGCRAFLEGLGRLDTNGKDRGREASHAANTYIVTIGPTTEDFLKDQFGCVPDACAQKPNPEMVCMAIEEHMRKHELI